MADIAIFRINYKSDFILTLNSDAGWMTPFCIKFWTGAPSQAYFVGFDGTTYTHCAPVDGEPTKLLVQFDDHNLPIGDLKFQIGYHFTVADFPTSVEDEVLNQASVIIEVDDAPAQVMLDLNGETAPEIEFSLPAYANEAQRIANEEQRIAAEAIRIANEESRLAAETIRQQNEDQRISNEESRVTEFARLKQESETATADANAAATRANEKAALAADKAALAQAAATLANAKAQLAADKAALADAAATLANDKAALAQQKAAYAQAQGDYAQAQGDYAKAQGDYAKEQGDYAKEQGDTAQADHERAEADHTTAADDHTTAAADHTTAASDHTRAEGDHTTAASDHTRAEGDHTTAASDHTRAESDHTTAAADHETAASDHTRAESDHAAVEVYVDSLGAFDISSYHATGGELAKYADLTAALGNGAANIPEAIRKGGMSVKFVQSSDNNYVQYRLMAEDFTTDVTQWAICDSGVYVENHEFIRLYTDSDGKILWAIKADGDIYFGVGVPKQIKGYIQSKISELSLDEYEDIVTFLDDLINGDKTLQQLLNEKVDKVTGKSLINSDYASRISYIESPEWITIVTDQNDNILYGIRTNGDFYFGSGCPHQIEAYVLAHKQEIIEELSTKVDKVSGKSLIDAEYSSNVSTINSIEWYNVVTDTDGKIIEGINSSKKQYFCNVSSSGSISAKEGIFNVLNIKALNLQESSFMEVDEIEWSVLLLDGKNNILFGIKKDGSTFPVSTAQLTAIKEYIDNLEKYTKHFEIPFDALKKEVIELPEYGNVIATQYSYILEEIQVNGTAYFHFSTDLGATWTTSENTIGDITHVHIFLDGTILVCGRKKAYTTKDFITFTESVIYDIDGSVLSQLPRDGFYSLMHHDTCNIINGVEIEIWGEYILDRGEHPCVWYTMDKGATIRCAFKADTTEVDGVVTTCRHIHKVSYCEKNNRFYITTGDTPSTSPTIEEIHFISGTLNNGVWTWTELGSGSSFKFGIPFFDENFMYLITDYTSASQNEQKGIIYVPISDIEDINNDIDVFRYAHRCKANEWVTIDDLPMAPVDIAMDGNGNKIFFGDYRAYGYLWIARKGFEFERVGLSKKCIFNNVIGPNFNGDLFAQGFDGTVPYTHENLKLNRGRSINLTEMMRNNRVDDFMKQLNYIYKF